MPISCQSGAKKDARRQKEEPRGGDPWAIGESIEAAGQAGSHAMELGSG